jgi:hypothetical protein
MKFSKGEIICRVNLAYPDGALVCNGYDATGGLLAHQVGGGFALVIPAEEARRFRLVEKGERDGALFRKGRFGLADSERVFDGWSNGHLWNGWGMPGFEFGVCAEILGWMGDDRARHDGGRDAFTTVNQDGEEEVWPAEEMSITDGSRIKVYRLGGGSWTWEEA